MASFPGLDATGAPPLHELLARKPLDASRGTSLYYDLRGDNHVRAFISAAATLGKKRMPYRTCPELAPQLLSNPPAWGPP